MVQLAVNHIVRYMRDCRFIFFLFLVILSDQPLADYLSQQELLFIKVDEGTSCTNTINNGLICDYKIGESLEFSIKDVGGSDTVIGFHLSNIDNEFYAVMYFGCVVVVHAALERGSHLGAEVIRCVNAHCNH